jgi:hypothetical protein
LLHVRIRDERRRARVRRLPWITSHTTAGGTMIRQLRSGVYRLYSRKKDPRTGKRKNLGTFKTREAAERHESQVQFFKRAH